MGPEAETKGARTRARIVREAADLFNVHGYAGTSIADVLNATGLEKGGLYNHFPGGKDELALEALEYALTCMRKRRTAALQAPGPARERLLEMIAAFVDDPNPRPIKGGCPIQNVAAEADDGGPELAPLLRRAQRALADWQTAIESVVKRGVDEGDFEAGTRPRDVAVALIAGLEGGLMMSRLTRDRKHLQSIGTFLRSYVSSLATTHV
jgi:AcrR family transcriptional regulator